MRVATFYGIKQKDCTPKNPAQGVLSDMEMVCVASPLTIIAGIFRIGTKPSLLALRQEPRPCPMLFSRKPRSGCTRHLNVDEIVFYGGLPM